MEPLDIELVVWRGALTMTTRRDDRCNRRHHHHQQQQALTPLIRADNDRFVRTYHDT